MKVLHSYLTFWRGRFWKKNNVLAQFWKYWVIKKNMRFSKCLAVHLNIDRFRRNFTESIFIWNKTFCPMDQQIFFALMAKKIFFHIFNFTFLLIKGWIFHQFCYKSACILFIYVIIFICFLSKIWWERHWLFNENVILKTSKVKFKDL